MLIPNKAPRHVSPRECGIFLHVSPRMSCIAVPTSRERRAEWRDAAWIHYSEMP